MKTFGWAVIGPGKIAHRFADAVHRTDGAGLVVVQGRDSARAAAFAQSWSRDGTTVKATTDVDALLSDDHVDGIYIATPHAFHADAIGCCLAAGKPVLCEKPLVVNQAEGVAAISLSRENRVFLMEAVWTRFLPVYAVVREWLQQGAIGGVRAIQSSFCFNLPFDPAHRAFDPAQAGGSLLDLGIYNLTMTRWILAMVLGKCPPLKSLHASAVLASTGVDQRLAATLEFADGVTSQFVCGFDASADNTLRIIGERGVISVPSFWQGTDAQLRVAGKDAVNISRPFRVNGFEGEIEEAMARIRQGDIESPVISHAETLETLVWMDRIRDIVCVRYPFEHSPGKCGPSC